MKKFILILGLTIFTLSETKAQQEQQFITTANYSSVKTRLMQQENTLLQNSYVYSGNNPVKDYHYYMTKSKNNFTAGCVTLGSGVLLGVVGIIFASADDGSRDNGWGNEKNDDEAAVLFLCSAASGIASIPLMIMGSVYRHKAKVMLKAQKTGFGVPQNVDKNIMGVTMSLPIGK